MPHSCGGGITVSVCLRALDTIVAAYLTGWAREGIFVHISNQVVAPVSRR